MPFPDLLRALLSAHGTSGYETVPGGLWRDAASAFADVRVDDMGNSYATVAGRRRDFWRAATRSADCAKSPAAFVRDDQADLVDVADDPEGQAVAGAAGR
jgi:hypothetical protein